MHVHIRGREAGPSPVQPVVERPCELCGAPATLRLYREGRARAIDACDRDGRLASEALGGATLVRRTAPHA